MTTLTLQVTEVRFDFDDLDFTPEEQQAVLDDVLGNVFEVEVDDGYDDEVVADALVEEVTNAVSFCVVSLNYRHILKWHSKNCHTPHRLPAWSLLHYIRTWDTQWLTLFPETSTVLCLVMINGIWSMLWQVMLWIMMILSQKMFTPFAAKSILSSTIMIDTYNFTGDAVTFIGMVGVVSTGIIIVTAFRRYYSSPMRK